MARHDASRHVARGRNRHDRIHVARAGARARRRPSLGHLFVRRHSLRDVDGPACVRWRDVGRRDHLRAERRSPSWPMAIERSLRRSVRIVDRCLDKNPASRFQSAGDLAFAIESLSSPSGVGDVPRRSMRRARKTQSRARMDRGRGVRGRLRRRPEPCRLVVRGPAARRTAGHAIQRASADGWTLSFNVQGQQGASAPLAVSPDGRRLAMVVKRY